MTDRARQMRVRALERRMVRGYDDVKVSTRFLISEFRGSYSRSAGGRSRPRPPVPATGASTYSSRLARLARLGLSGYY